VLSLNCDRQTLGAPEGHEFYLCAHHQFYFCLCAVVVLCQQSQSIVRTRVAMYSDTLSDPYHCPVTEIFWSIYDLPPDP